MKASGYVDNNLTTQRDWKNSQSIHKKKLDKILHSPAKRSSTPIASYLNKLKKRHQANSLEKIERENDRLYSKILRITPTIDVSHTQTCTNFAQQTPKLNKSSNFLYNKSKLIAVENKKLSKKLENANPSLTVKQLRSTYKKILKLKKNISKPHTFTIR